MNDYDNIWEPLFSHMGTAAPKRGYNQINALIFKKILDCIPAIYFRIST